MNRSELYAKVDHTLLKPETTWEEIQLFCDDAIAFQTASVCIPPCYVKPAHDYVNGKMTICTVIGFPLGNQTTETKVFEAQNAIENGAEEIDMVINIGALKAGDTEYVLQEIRRLKAAVGKRILKVIIETCLLTEAEKITMCKIVTQAGADYIKTSTGFSTAGATFEDIELFSRYIGPHVKMKAAGGISSFADGERFIELGASRLGTSRIIKIAKAEKNGAVAKPDGSY